MSEAAAAAADAGGGALRLACRCFPAALVVAARGDLVEDHGVDLRARSVFGECVADDAVDDRLVFLGSSEVEVEEAV